MSPAGPNVVVVVLDTARYADVRTTVDGTQTTPFLNELASTGTSFEAAYTPVPWTLPAHASLFTGTYPSKHGAHAGHKHLSDELTTIAELFAAAGYSTVAVSNNTWISEEFGFGRGFETFHKTWQYVQNDVDLGSVAREYEGMAKLRELAAAMFEGNPVLNLANAVYGQFLRNATDNGARKTNRWIRSWLRDRRGADPFFLFVNYLEPHLPYRPPREHAAQFLPDGTTYEEAMDVSQDAWAYLAGKTSHSERDFEALRALYRGELSYVDQRVRELKETLVRAGAWDDTVLVVTGDHGENIGDHGLMDHQYCLYETLTHVPLLACGGPFSDGESVRDRVQLTDVGPTLAELAGLDEDDVCDQFQGRSFHPDTAADTRKLVFGEYLSPQPSMEALEKRVGPLSDEVFRYDRSLRMVRDARYKLVRGSDGSRELYEVTTDPDEKSNVVDELPDVAERLEGTLEAWLGSFDHAETDGDVSISDETAERLEDLGYLH